LGTLSPGVGRNSERIVKKSLSIAVAIRVATGGAFDAAIFIYL